MTSLKVLSLDFRHGNVELRASLRCGCPPSLGRLSHSKSLALRATPGLLKVEGGITAPPTLQRLELVNCDVTSLADAVTGDVTSLTCLVVLESRRQGGKTPRPRLAVPAGLGQLTRLRALALSTAAVPPATSRLKELRHLMIDQATVTATQLGQLSHLTKLEGLRMQNCRGAASNAMALCTPRSLRSLQLENCSFGLLPAHWPAVAHLTKPSLANNQNSALPMRKCIAAIGNAPQLRYLDWSYNQLPIIASPLGLMALDRLGLRSTVQVWFTADVMWVASVTRANTRLKLVTEGKGPLWQSEDFGMAFD